MIKGSQVESNISTMSFPNMLNNVGLRLQPCRTPTEGVNDARFLLLPLKQLCHTCFSVEI